MSTYLLDTHAVLWALTEPARLSATARHLIEDPAVPLLVSAATAWEVSTKHRIGKLPQADAVLAGWEHHLDRLGANRLPVDHEHALLAGRLDWGHRDPFDRMLAAQAMLAPATLISGDAAFTDLPGVAIAW